MVAAMRKVLPNHGIVTIDPDHDEVFHVLYDLDALTQIPGERHLYRAGDGSVRARLEGEQRWSGIYDEQGSQRFVQSLTFSSTDI